MKNLKTLKDIFPKDAENKELIEYKIKAEAVKWVKYWRGLTEIPNKENEHTDTDFMHFFNLQEEDLK